MNALTQALQGFAKWASPQPANVQVPKQTNVFTPKGFQNAVQNVVALATLRPNLVRSMAPVQPLKTTPTPIASITPTKTPTQVFAQQKQPTTMPTRIPTTLPVRSASPTPTTIPARVPVQTTASISPTSFQYPGRNPRFTNYPIAPNVVHAINTAAKTFNLQPGILYDVAGGETTFDPTLVNRTPEGIAAKNPTGLFQFTDPTWQTVLSQYNNRPGMSLKLPNTDRFDPMTSALAAAYLISKGQLGKWDASRYEGVNKWGPFYTQEELNPYYVQTLGYRK